MRGDIAYLASAVDRLADRSSTLCIWDGINRETLQHTFARFALPIHVGFPGSESSVADASGNYLTAIDWVARYSSTHSMAAAGAPTRPRALCQSATLTARVKLSMS